MCILSYLPAGVEADMESLENGGLNNPDGHGWAIAVDGTMIVGKALALADALEEFETTRKQYPGGDALFHSRWATHGSIKPANCHPFYVGNSKLTVVGHNGILPSEAHPRKGDDRSDTKLFADEILSTRYRRLDKPRAFEALTNWIGSYNKLVILTVDPRYRNNAYLVNEKAGNWDTFTGIWHSNYDYLGTSKWYSQYLSKKSTGLVTTYWKDPATLGTVKAEAVDSCLMCNYGTVSSHGFCDDCGTCQDCFEHVKDCLCYYAGSLADDEANLSQFLSAEEAADLEAAIARDEERDYTPNITTQVDADIRSAALRAIGGM